MWGRAVWLRNTNVVLYHVVKLLKGMEGVEAVRENKGKGKEQTDGARREEDEFLMLMEGGVEGK